MDGRSFFYKYIDIYRFIDPDILDRFNNVCNNLGIDQSIAFSYMCNSVSYLYNVIYKDDADTFREKFNKVKDYIRNIENDYKFLYVFNCLINGYIYENVGDVRNVYNKILEELYQRYNINISYNDIVDVFLYKKMYDFMDCNDYYKFMHDLLYSKYYSSSSICPSRTYINSGLFILSLLYHLNVKVVDKDILKYVVELFNNNVDYFSKSKWYFKLNIILEYCRYLYKLEEYIEKHSLFKDEKSVNDFKAFYTNLSKDIVSSYIGVIKYSQYCNDFKGVDVVERIAELVVYSNLLGNSKEHLYNFIDCIIASNEFNEDEMYIKDVNVNVDDVYSLFDIDIKDMVRMYRVYRKYMRSVKNSREIYNIEFKLSIPFMNYKDILRFVDEVKDSIICTDIYRKLELGYNKYKYLVDYKCIQSIMSMKDNMYDKFYNYINEDIRRNYIHDSIKYMFFMKSIIDCLKLYGIKNICRHVKKYIKNLDILLNIYRDKCSSCVINRSLYFYLYMLSKPDGVELFKNNSKKIYEFINSCRKNLYNMNYNEIRSYMDKFNNLSLNNFIDRFRFVNNILDIL